MESESQALREKSAVWLLLSKKKYGIFLLETKMKLLRLTLRRASDIITGRFFELKAEVLHEISQAVPRTAAQLGSPASP